jgi:RNA polymerase I-specific transcription initiation factor RRN3
VFTLSKDRFDADLTTFFPFDPYKLPRSSVYIEGIYREWSSVALDDEDEDDEDEDEDEADEYGEDGESESESRQNAWAYPSSRPIAANSKGGESSDEAGALGASFGGMSISPAIAVPMRSVDSSF